MKGMNDVETSDGAETDTLSPVLFDDSPRSSPIIPGVVGKMEVFGTIPEEAVREMRFRIEQKTTLTASAGNAKNCRILCVICIQNMQFIKKHSCWIFV